jgi:hypothetical protein
VKVLAALVLLFRGILEDLLWLLREWADPWAAIDREMAEASETVQW